ncbi:hypothetical protein, partial [Endozoicomonas sp. ONNA1]|uniref:hypothetical protein n=1 Tax=Endozoicomonas sp. ONNA1 TaxID=2828740 RepID=UPI0021476E28
MAEDDRLLVLVWLLECLRQNTQKPVLELLGAHGSGKSHTTEVLRSLVDPSTASLRHFPSKDEDLFISAQSNWIIPYENVSHLSEAKQDLLCQICTGSAYVKRTAYSDASETVLSACRPQVINGITPVATRLDLIDRCISIELPTMTPGNRQTKTELEQAFQRARGKLFGALLQLLSGAMMQLPLIKLKSLPRMADFALLGEAVCSSLGQEGEFVHIYEANRSQLISTSLEGSPVANALLEMCQARGTGQVFNGVVSNLLKQLASYRTDYCNWPKTPRGLGNVLRREQEALKLKGIEISFTGKTSRGRNVVINYKSGAQHTLSAQRALGPSGVALTNARSAH